MQKKSIFTFISSFLLISTVNIFSQVPILDENGNATGLINMNPDPDGEPWIAGGLPPLTEEDIAVFNRLPRFKLWPGKRSRVSFYL